MKTMLPRLLVFCCLLPLLSPAKEPLLIKPLTEIRVPELPAGELWWRIENFRSLEDARAAAGRWSLVAEADGRIWLFTLGPAGGASPGATARVAEVGPIPRVEAANYLLRLNLAEGPPGSETPIHTHPGSEAFYVLRGEHGILSPRGQMVVPAGQGEAGRGANIPMLVSSRGQVPLRSLVMFVVDADRPFSEPACFPDDPPPTRP